MADIEVTHAEGDEYRVVVREGEESSEHTVVVTDGDLVRFAPDTEKEALVEESFRFLLEREPKESILGRFELPVIARYFPEYPVKIKERVRE